MRRQSCEVELNESRSQRSRVLEAELEPMEQNVEARGESKERSVETSVESENSIVESQKHNVES